MYFLIARKGNGEMYRATFSEAIPWSALVDAIEGDVIELFKSETLTGRCFKEYFHDLNSRSNIEQEYRIFPNPC